MSRTEVLVAALTQQLRERRLSIDSASDLAEVTLTLRLQAGTSWLRGVVYQEERVIRSRDQRTSTGG